jgi:hypothetical protein
MTAPEAAAEVVLDRNVRCPPALSKGESRFVKT